MVKDNNNTNGTNVQKINHKNTWHNSRYPHPNKNSSNNKSQTNIDTCTELLNKVQMNNNQNKKTYNNKYNRNKNEGQTKTADNNYTGHNQTKKHKQKSYQNNNYSSQNMHPQLNVIRHIMMQEKIWPYTYCKMPTINFILPHLLNTVVYVVYPGYGIQRSNQQNIQIQVPTKPTENNKQLKNVSCFNCGASGHIGNDCTEPSMEELLLHDTYRLNYLSPSDVYFHNSTSTSSTSSSSEILDKI